MSKEIVKEKIKINIQFEDYPDYIETGNKRIDGQMHSEMFIVLSYYNDYTKKYSDADAYYAGSSFADIFHSIHLIKNFIIEEYNAKCY